MGYRRSRGAGTWPRDCRLSAKSSSATRWIAPPSRTTCVPPAPSCTWWASPALLPGNPAQAASIAHFIYVSVAQPAPVMKAYIQTRAECEGFIRTSGLHATILRPWYVIGPGHWWPVCLLPLYSLMKRFPATRHTALRLELVTHKQMTGALLWAIEHPVQGIRIMDVRHILGTGMHGSTSTKGGAP